MDILSTFLTPDFFSPRQVSNASNTFLKRLSTKQYKRPEMDKKDEMDLYARINKQSYNVNRQNIKGYEYKPELSHIRRAVYYNPNTDQYIISQRGTDIKSKQDLADDYAILQNDLSKTARHNTELNWVKKFMKDKEDKITLTGHSLGSNHSKLISLETGLPMVGFSEGSVPTFNNLVDNFISNALPSNIVNYKVAYDPISSTNPFSENVEVKELYKHNPHALDHYTIDEMDEYTF